MGGRPAQSPWGDMPRWEMRVEGYRRYLPVISFVWEVGGGIGRRGRHGAELGWRWPRRAARESAARRHTGWGGAWRGTIVPGPRCPALPCPPPPPHRENRCCYCVRGERWQAVEPNSGIESADHLRHSRANGSIVTWMEVEVRMADGGGQELTNCNVPANHSPCQGGPD